MKCRKNQRVEKNWLQSDEGFSLMELIVSIVVSSVVILSAVAFFSFSLSQYRKTAEETELMMESQIAVNTIREVVMEAKEPVEAGSYTSGGVTYPYFAVRTGRGINVEEIAGVDVYYHLFLLDTAGDVILYHRESGAGSDNAEDEIQSTFLADGMIDKKDLKRYFLADYALDMSLDCSNPQLPILSMEFDMNGRSYYTSEMIFVRNVFPDEEDGDE